MKDAIAVGPLLLPLELLLVLASTIAAALVGRRVAGQSREAFDSVLWRTLLVAFASARLAFVMEYRSMYLAAPLTILDLRDGGWNAGVGLSAAWLYAVYRWRANVILARPLRWALGIGTGVFILGTALLTIRAAPTQTMPDLAFVAVDGQDVRLASFAGKPTVVNLWATWCPPCVREMPVLQKAQGERADIHFVFLNQGENAAVVRRWLTERGLTLQNVLIDEPRRASAAFKQQGYPTTLFFDAQGRLVSRRIGELSAATLYERLTLIAK